MRIQQAQPQDMPRIQALYTEAILWQRRAGFPFWSDLDAAVIEADIAAGHQSILIIEQQIAGIFSLCPPAPMDRDLWHGKNPDAACYINRIIVSAPWRGKALFPAMLNWCDRTLIDQGIHLLRLDTWAESTALIRHYATFSFAYIGERTTSISHNLSPQYRGIRLALMERAVGERAHPV